MPSDDSLQRYREVFEGIPVGIYRTTPAGQFVHANPAMVALLGYRSYEELAAVNAGDLYLDPTDWQVWRDMMNRDGMVIDHDTRKVRRDGTMVWLRDNARAVRDETGAVLYFDGAVVDVTASHRMADQLVRSERLASIGVLAAGVAHEINNPLAYVTTNVDFAVEQVRRMLRERTGDVDADVWAELARALGEAADGAERVRGIVAQLSNFAKDREDIVAFADIGDVVESAVRVVQNELRHSASLQVDVDALPPVVGSPTKLVQVFVNLLVNAAQACAARPVQQSVRVVGRRGEGDTVVISVIDTAGGIEPEVLDRIFDPFFTTKARTAGTGLGLTISQNTVVAVGGRIDVNSELGKGTTFRVTLPVSQRVEEPVESQRRFSSIPAGEKLRVLIVDDEPLIGRSLRRALRPDFDVTVVTAGKQAVEKIESGDWFDAILCDVMMPEMNGTDFHRWLLDAYPEQARRLAFITGGAFSGQTIAYLESTDVPALTKPISNQQVRSLLHEIVG